MSSLHALFFKTWNAGLRVIRSGLPIFIVIAGFTATLALSHSIRVQDNEDVWRTVDGEAGALSRTIQGVITAHIQSLLRMARRSEFRRPSMMEWQDDARMVLEHSFGFEIIDWVDPSFQTRWSVHTGGGKTLDKDAAFGEPLKEALRKVREGRTVTVTRAIDLPYGGTGISMYVPIFSGPSADRFDGFIAAVLNLHSTMTGLLDVNFLRRYDLEILEGKKPIYTKPGAQEETKKEWAREADLKLYGVVWFGSLWKIRVWPRPAWLHEMRSSLDAAVLLMGLALTGLLALLTHFFQLAQTRAAQLEAANANLKSEVDEREQAQAALADFTAIIVHDLRSPLSNVISIVDMMRAGLFGSVNPDQRKWLEKAEHTTRSSVDLISDFLDVSKLESGRLELRKESLDLRHLIRSSVENYSLAAQDKGILLKDEIASSLPRLEADPRRLEQVLSNLLSNALKFTPEGGQVVVGAVCNHKEIEIWVRDTGVGIPANEIGQIFEKYKQTTSGATSEHKGTGLGLVICKMIVEAHGGTIRAQSENGATFTFTLPRA
jgi:signal transduction histidine kinase